MDWEKHFKERGFKFKYTYTLGYIDYPDSIQIIESWEKERLTEIEAEKQKRKIMKHCNLPIIKIEISDL